ncbi:hypothetical protein [Methylobacterium nigriterrae]|uniref:hypothetical protein n=1 Tax=Methylobacterium nigriterrae TaxID=3127512 RepID=UPI003013EBDB
MMDGGQAFANPAFSNQSCADGAILFRNDDWRVLGEGLEHRGTGYLIPREAIDRRRHEGLWDWPLHMAEKRWCTPSLFREAFLVALDRFGIARDGLLGPSFALGFGIRAGQGIEAAEGGFVSLGEIVRPKPARAASRQAGPQRRGGSVRARA